MRSLRVSDIKSQSTHIDCNGGMIEMSISRREPYRMADEKRELKDDGLNTCENYNWQNPLACHKTTDRINSYWELNDFLKNTVASTVVRSLLKSDTCDK